MIPFPQMSDDQAVTSVSLLQRAKVQDQLAWAKLVALYQPLVLHWCRRGGAEGAEGQDVAQEVFLAASTAKQSSPVVGHRTYWYPARTLIDRRQSFRNASHGRPSCG